MLLNALGTVPFILSSPSPGNVFYLVMPKDQMGALTEESSTDEVTEPSPSEAPEAVSVSSQQADEEQETLRRSHPEVSSSTTGLSQSRASSQRRAIKGMDAVFTTMDELMKKLHRLRVNTTTHTHTQLAIVCRVISLNFSFLHCFFFSLQEIEADHYRLIKTEKKKSPLGQNSDSVVHTPASVMRTPSMDRGAGNCEWGKKKNGIKVMLKRLMLNRVLFCLKMCINSHNIF